MDISQSFAWIAWSFAFRLPGVCMDISMRRLHGPLLGHLPNVCMDCQDIIRRLPGQMPGDYMDVCWADCQKIPGRLHELLGDLPDARRLLRVARALVAASGKVWDRKI